MAQITISDGRLSELTTNGSRADWSQLKKKIKELEPAEVITLSCPAGMKMSRLRTTALMIGARIKRKGWKLATRTKDNKLHIFLAPK